MDETLISVVVGGLIAVLPTLLSTARDSKKERERRAHEIALRRLDLVETARIEAVRDFADQFGAFIAPGYSDAHDPETLLASMQRAALYVEPATISAMHAALPVLVEYCKKDNDLHSRMALLDSEEVCNMTRRLRMELLSVESSFKQPPTIWQQLQSALLSTTEAPQDRHP